MEDAQQLHLRLLKFNRGDSTDEGEALDVLRTLEKSTITYAILKETKLGHTIGKMRKHENEKLANQAKLLVKSWKSMALSPKPTQGATPTLERKLSGMSSDGDRIPKKSVAAPPTNGSSSSSTNGVKAEPKPVVPAPPKPTAPALSRPTSKGPFIPTGFDKVRATVRTKLKEILQASEGGDAEDTAVAIEVSMARMFNMGYPGENKKDYTTKFRQLSFNLKKNSPLREDLLQDVVSAEQLINMTAEELATEEKRHEIQKLRDDAFNKARLDWADANEDKINKQCGIENAKGLFTCGRCKSSKTSNTQKQTRSADEPMTVQLQRANGSSDFVQLHQARTEVRPTRQQQQQHKRQHIGIAHHTPPVRAHCLQPLRRARAAPFSLPFLLSAIHLTITIALKVLSPSLPTNLQKRRRLCNHHHHHPCCSHCSAAPSAPAHEHACPQLMAPLCYASSSLRPSSPCQQYHIMCACINNEEDGANQFACQEDDSVAVVLSPNCRGVSLTQEREVPKDPDGDQEQLVRLLGCVSWSNLLVDEALESSTTHHPIAVAELHDVAEEETICLCPKSVTASGQGMTHKCQCVRARHATRSCVTSKLKRHWKWIAIALTALTALALWLCLSPTPIERSSLAASPSEALAVESETTAKALVKPVRPSVALAAQASSPPSFPSLEIHGDAEMERMMDIYCRGPILHAVQMANVFSDSKHFVDMPIKENSSAFDIIVDFQKRKLAMTEFRPSLGPSLSAHNNNHNNHNNHNIDNKRLKRELSHEVLLRHFVSDHFDPPGSELIPITPFDYQELQIPPMIADIQDERLRDWAFSLHQLWRTLGRVPNLRVRSSYLHAKPFEDPHLHRIQNILIVPGGRFRESYYWDSYWIVQGLLVSNMKHTARGVVNNLLEYVAEFGFVPNGGRIYYLTRSQPPMLSDMVKLIAQAGRHNATKVEFDASYLNATVPILEREYLFWMQLGPGGHAVEFVRPSADDATKNVSYLLNRYTSSANHPRPESYREDVDVAAEIYGTSDDGIAAADTESKKDMYYNDIIAAAESGWDFSSRWLRDKSDMKTMFTSCVIPVDLNAIMYRMEKNLEAFHKYLGNGERARFFRHASRQRMHAMNEVLWSDEHNTWKDYNLETQTHSNIVSVSDYTPLWAKAFDSNDTERLQKVVKSLQDSGLLQVGGIQTTNVYSGQQWDAPNAWPPEQDIVIEGLLAVNTKEAHELARELMQSWVHSGLIAYRQTGLMFEKYNATEIGGLGVGGEYFPQFGFGWTNGVILKLLTIHQNLLLD